nr:MAG TPA: helix-turn-helix domain protein [Caudoviricetes sp.]
MNDLGQKIKELRMDKGLTMEEFGKLFDASKSIVSRWERDISVPNEKRLKNIAKLAGKTVSEFVYGVPSAERVKKTMYLLEHARELDAIGYEWLFDVDPYTIFEIAVYLLEGCIDKFEDELRELGYYDQ